MKRLFKKSALILLILLLSYGVNTCCAVKLLNCRTGLFIAITEQHKISWTADAKEATDFIATYPLDGCYNKLILRYNAQYDLGWMPDGRVGLVATTSWLPMHLWGYDEYTLRLYVPSDRQWYLAVDDAGELVLRSKINESMSWVLY